MVGSCGSWWWKKNIQLPCQNSGSGTAVRRAQRTFIGGAQHHQLRAHRQHLHQVRQRRLLMPVVEAIPPGDVPPPAGALANHFAIPWCRSKIGNTPSPPPPGTAWVTQPSACTDLARPWAWLAVVPAGRQAGLGGTGGVHRHEAGLQEGGVAGEGQRLRGAPGWRLGAGFVATTPPTPGERGVPCAAGNLPTASTPPPWGGIGSWPWPTWAIFLENEPIFGPAPSTVVCALTLPTAGENAYPLPAHSTRLVRLPSNTSLAGAAGR